VLLGAGLLVERAIAAASTWVDYLAERPSTARILLREVADGRAGSEPPLVRHTRAFHELVAQALAQSPEDPHAASPPPVDPVLLASVVAGSTVFFIAAMPALLPGLGFDPLDAERLDSYKREILATVRRLLGAG